METLLLKLFNFITEFDAYGYFFQTRYVLLSYFVFLIFACDCARDYMFAIFSIKKSDDKIKYIRKEYPFYQRFFLIHMYKNVYKKVDRFWFDVAYRSYLAHMLLFVVVILLSVFSRFFSAWNPVVGVLFVIHIVFIVVSIVTERLGILISSYPGIEYHDEDKYRKKNW